MSIIVALALLIITVALGFIGANAESDKWLIIAGVIGFIAIWCGGCKGTQKDLKK